MAQKIPSTMMRQIKGDSIVTVDDVVDDDSDNDRIMALIMNGHDAHNDGNERYN